MIAKEQMCLIITWGITFLAAEKEVTASAFTLTPQVRLSLDWYPITEQDTRPANPIIHHSIFEKEINALYARRELSSRLQWTLVSR